MSDEDSSSRKPRPRSPSRPPIMSVMIGGQALLGVASIWADVPPTEKRSAPPASLVQVNDPLRASITTFLRDYHRALVTGNKRFLAEHTAFPLPYAELVYDMESKVQPKTLPTVGALLKVRQQLRWPDVLVPASYAQADLDRLHQGKQKCGDAKAPEIPDFSQGPAALDLRGLLVLQDPSKVGEVGPNHPPKVTLTYLAEPCSAEVHQVTLTFVLFTSEHKWRLTERAVRRGLP